MRYVVCLPGPPSLLAAAAVYAHCHGVQGVWEKDEIRKDDSFTAFEEIFELAITQEVRCLFIRTGIAH